MSSLALVAVPLLLLSVLLLAATQDGSFVDAFQPVGFGAPKTSVRRLLTPPVPSLSTRGCNGLFGPGAGTRSNAVVDVVARMAASGGDEGDEAEGGEQSPAGDEEDEEESSSLPPPRPSKIDNIIKDLHDQSYRFRIVVIGNGAILETTSILGPYMAESTSPKTGERLVTLASKDKSFEFHLKVEQIGKISFVETKKGEDDKVLRIVRMTHEESGGPICSLILADGSDEAADWFKTLTIRYGYEVCAGD